MKKRKDFFELSELCSLVRKLTAEGKYDSCINEICMAMDHYPHAPEPHNLMGIILEKTNNHASAMKHFRAAWALDPTYLPARHNLDTYGTFISYGKCAFDESDVSPALLETYRQEAKAEASRTKTVPDMISA